MSALISTGHAVVEASPSSSGRLRVPAKRPLSLPGRERTRLLDLRGSRSRSRRDAPGRRCSVPATRQPGPVHALKSVARHLVGPAEPGQRPLLASASVGARALPVTVEPDRPMPAQPCAIGRSGRAIARDRRSNRSRIGCADRRSPLLQSDRSIQGGRW